MSEDARNQADAAEMFEGVRSRDGNPVEPTRLEAKDSFCFSCHRGVACWNRCCHGADITLTPGDILRLSATLGLRPAEFLARYTVPAIWEKAGMPVAKLKMAGAEGDGPCHFLDGDNGCSIYENRPATCRYYPLGLASVKIKGEDGTSDFFFLVKETHCQGHRESKIQSVDAFREEQGVVWYDGINRGWFDILMKMVSWRTVGGPHGKDIDPRTRKMFFMVSSWSPIKPASGTGRRVFEPTAPTGAVSK